MIHHLHQDLFSEGFTRIIWCQDWKKNKRILENMSQKTCLSPVSLPSQEGGFVCSQVWKGWGPAFFVGSNEWWMITGDKGWRTTTISDGWFRIVVLTKLVPGGRERGWWNMITHSPRWKGQFSRILMLWNRFKLIGAGSYWHPPTICFGKLKKSNRICFGVGKLWKKLHWTKPCLLSLGTKRVLVVFVSAGQVRITRVYKSMKSMQTTLLKILHVPVLSFRPVSWILKLLCREDDRRQAVENTKSVSCACQISRLAGSRGWRCAWSQDRQNLQGQNSSCYNPFTTVSPAPFSTMNRYWSEVPTSRLLGSGLSFQFSKCLLPCLVLQRLWNLEVSVANIGASSFQAFWVLWLGTSRRTESPHQLLIALSALIAMPAMPRSVELAFLFWVLISWWMPSWHSWILTRHGGPWEVIHPDVHGGIQSANGCRTDKGKKDRVSLSLPFLWLLQHFCAATSALACQGTDHPNKIFPQAKQVEKSKSAISCSTRKANTSFWNHSWNGGPYLPTSRAKRTSYQQWTWVNA